MIQVQLARAPCGRLVFRSQGHGEPRVCAAASMLDYTLRAALRCRDGVKDREGEGWTLLHCPDTARNRDCMDVVLTGYALLEQAYPEQIQVDNGLA